MYTTSLCVYLNTMHICLFRYLFTRRLWYYCKTFRDSTVHIVFYIDVYICVRVYIYICIYIYMYMNLWLPYFKADPDIQGTPKGTIISRSDHRCNDQTPNGRALASLSGKISGPTVGRIASIKKHKQPQTLNPNPKPSTLTLNPKPKTLALNPKP